MQNPATRAADADQPRVMLRSVRPIGAWCTRIPPGIRMNGMMAKVTRIWSSHTNRPGHGAYSSTRPLHSGPAASPMAFAEVVTLPTSLLVLAVSGSESDFIRGGPTSVRQSGRTDRSASRPGTPGGEAG